MKIYVIDQQGCEWGGVMTEKAFATSELAQAWVDENSTVYSGIGCSFSMPKGGADSFEIVELEVEGA